MSPPMPGQIGGKRGTIGISAKACRPTLHAAILQIGASAMQCTTLINDTSGE
jgi:hypothetical protein